MNLNGVVLIYESPMASNASTTVPVKVLEKECLAMGIISCYPTQISLERRENIFKREKFIYILAIMNSFSKTS